MGFWTKVEKWSEKHVEGFFKQKFAGAVQPAEIAKMISREMRDRKTVSVSKIYIPNEYTVYVSDKDWENISAMAGSLSRELEDFIINKAEQRKYALVGPPTVKFAKGEAKVQGMLEVRGIFTELLPEEPKTKIKQQEGRANQEDNFNHTIVINRGELLGAKAPEGSETAANTLVGQGSAILASLTVKSPDGYQKEYPLGLRTVLIGRRRASDIPLLDENVSRTHAEINYSDGRHLVKDHGSTNGVYVNGQRVLKKNLSDGDVIRVGNSTLEYRVI